MNAPFPVAAATGLASADDAALPATALLAEITANLSSGADIRALLQRFLAPILQLAHARAGAVRVLSEDGQLRLISDLGLPTPLSCAERMADRHCGTCGRAADSEAPAWSGDLANCTEATRDMLAGLGCEHMLAVPLRHRERVLGVYNLFFDAASVPSTEVRAMLRSIGELLGLALDNARLERENLRATVMQERQMMAAEVHDSIAQNLAFIRMRLPLLEQAVVTCDEAQALRYLHELRQALGQANGSLREIVTEFRTPLDPQGLAHALQSQVSEFAGRTGIAAELDNRAPELSLASGHESQVVHIVGEALANIARHAQARHTSVSVAVQAGWVDVRVEDDGLGLATTGDPPRAGHHGIGIMGDRARRIGGELSLQPRGGGGTVVRLRFPAHPGAGRDASPERRKAVALMPST